MWQHSGLPRGRSNVVLIQLCLLSKLTDLCLSNLQHGPEGTITYYDCDSGLYGAFTEIIARSKFCNIKSYLAHWKVKARYRATPISCQEFRVLLKDTSAGGLLPFSVQQHTIKCNKDVFLQSVICLSQSHPLHCSTSVLLFLVMSYTWFKLSQEIGIHAAISFLFKAGYLRSFFCM